MCIEKDSLIYIQHDDNQNDTNNFNFFFLTNDTLYINYFR